MVPLRSLSQLEHPLPLEGRGWPQAPGSIYFSASATSALACNSVVS